MAVFGPQLIYTVIMFVLLTKLGKFYSFGRFILCNKLFRYLSPSSEDLKKAVSCFFYLLLTCRMSKIFSLYRLEIITRVQLVRINEFIFNPN